MSNRFSQTVSHCRPTSRLRRNEEPAASRIDRRSERSQRAIQKAFLSLIESCGYDAVTVGQVCRQAGVSRATFYAHYAGKRDLKTKGILSIKRHLTGAPHREDDARAFAFSRALFEHARDYRGIHRAMVGSSGGPVAHDALRHLIRDLVREDLTRRGRRPSTFAIEYYTGAMLGMLTTWLDAEARPTPTDMDRMFRELAVPPNAD